MSAREWSDLNWEVANKNVIDRPRAKTIDAGESPEWGKANGDNYGEHMVLILKEIIDFWLGKNERPS